MEFFAAGYSNVGNSKEVNQDSYLIKVAQTMLGDVALVVVADGMGGLANGELASATVIRAFSEWFDTRLAPTLETLDSSVDGFEAFVEGQWNGLIQGLNIDIMRYGMEKGKPLGTTITAFLAIGARYVIAHVGDSRAYELANEQIAQITTDQTFVKREMDLGRMTLEEALVHPQRNALLQCVGASAKVVPDIICGTLKKNSVYLLCTDGFRHCLSEEEMAQCFNPEHVFSRMEQTPEDEWLVEGPPLVIKDLAAASQLVMDRGERDNITALVLGVREGRR